MYRRQLVASFGALFLRTLSGCSTFQSDGPDQPFRFNASVFNTTPTADRPPVIQVEVTNIGNNPHILTITNDSFPFATAQATTSGSTLVLNEELPDTRGNECWSGTPRVLPRIDGQQFAPGESLTGKYAVLNAEDNEECWPAKTFEFTETYYLDPKDPNSTEQGTQFEWGFAVAVNEDSSITIQDREITTGK